jgi:hypothetical protein
VAPKRRPKRRQCGNEKEDLEKEDLKEKNLSQETFDFV